MGVVAVGSKQEMGASLEELEKAGLVELPPIADSFTQASTALAGLAVSAMFDARGPFATSSPKVHAEALADALVSATRKSGNVLDEVAQALVTTARDFARTDDDIAAAFTAAGGTL